jgi:hypothetical protein
MGLNTYSMAINYNVGGQFASNILFFQFDDSGFSNTADAAHGLCLGWQTANQTRLLNILSAHVTLMSYRARNVTAGGGFEGQVLLAAGVVGNRAGNLMAAGIGPCYVFVPTGNAKQRGRMFVPGISDSDASDGILTSAFLTVLNTSGSGFITPFAVTGGGGPVATPVVFTRKPAKVSRTIQHVLVSMNLAQVRRRQVPA